MSQPLYSIGTWDTYRQAFTPQAGVTVPWRNITLYQLRQHMHQLRARGYSCHRYRDEDGSHEDNDPWVLIERTDGMSKKKILKRWKR